MGVVSCWTVGGRVTVVAVAMAALGVAGCSGAYGPVVGPPKSTTETTGSTETSPPSGPSSAPLDPKALLAAVRPSVALVTTTISQGSGVLVDDGYVVTNAHVVDPYGAATITFEGAAAMVDVPVVGIDPFADIALLGPIVTDRSALPLAGSLDLEQGDDVYLVGYPGEFDAAPEPAISKGLVSRLRDYRPFEQTYIQTDAAIGGGQSGGALLDSRGQVVGISGLSFADQFALALSSPDVRRSIADIQHGSTPSYRHLVDAPAITDGIFDVANDLEFGLLVLRAADVARSLQFTVPEANEPTVEVFDLGGSVHLANQRRIDQELASDPSLTAADAGTVLTAAATGEYTISVPAKADLLINVGSGRSEGAAVEFASSLPVVVYEDTDDGQKINTGDTVTGVVDPFEFSDTFVLDMVAGDTVTIRVSAGGSDPVLLVIPPGVDPDTVPPVDDSSLGLFGHDAETTFTAQTSGPHEIDVWMNDWVVSGYRLDVDTA